MIIPQECSCNLLSLQRKVLQYLPPPLEITGVVRMSRSEICEDSLVLAAVCCCTLTSAASAKCISVFLSGLSSKFLQPMHLQMDEHMIFAFEVKQRKHANGNNRLFSQYEVKATDTQNYMKNSSCEQCSEGKPTS